MSPKRRTRSNSSRSRPRKNSTTSRDVKILVSYGAGVRAGSLQVSTSGLGRIFKTILLDFKDAPRALELHFVRSSHMKKLNHQFRKKNKPTDILSFNGLSRELLGSLVIDIDTAQKQALEYKHSRTREIHELFVHGVLHLLGFDHETPKDAEQMKKKEISVYRKSKVL